MNFNDDQWQSWTWLMRKTQEGNGEAYQRLLSEISPLVFNYVREKVSDPQKAEDVFQEVLFIFHKAKHTYRVDQPFRPWFSAVTQNAIGVVLSKKRLV